MFEAAGVARTERSIVNWCQPNRQGISCLDSYYDPNERRYYLTPQSVETAIQEEKAKARNNELSELVRSLQKDTEGPKKGFESDDDQVKELERENLDLTIANRGKDYLIEQLQKERGGFFDQLLAANRKVGELETELLQLAELKLSGEI
jgi:predicted RNase H-like nuclease (RuvC/YqgF family)